MRLDSSLLSCCILKIPHCWSYLKKTLVNNWFIKMEAWIKMPWVNFSILNFLWKCSELMNIMLDQDKFMTLEDVQVVISQDCHYIYKTLNIWLMLYVLTIKMLIKLKSYLVTFIIKQLNSEYKYWYVIILLAENARLNPTLKQLLKRWNFKICNYKSFLIMEVPKVLESGHFKVLFRLVSSFLCFLISILICITN